MKKSEGRNRIFDLDGQFPPGGMKMVTGPSGAKERITVFSESGLLSQTNPTKLARDINSVLFDPAHNIILKGGRIKLKGGKKNG